MSLTPGLPLRRGQNTIRTVWRRAVRRSRRRSRGGAHPGASRSQSGRRLGSARRRAVWMRKPGGRGQPQRRQDGVAPRGTAGRRGGRDVNSLCGSSLEAVAAGARAIALGEASLVIAGGVESMSRAPFVMAKPAAAFARDLAWADTTLGWRFINPQIESRFGVDSMAETAENVAAETWRRARDQDQFALRSQQRAGAAQASGIFAEEIVPVTVPQKKGPPASSPSTSIHGLTRR